MPTSPDIQYESICAVATPIGRGALAIVRLSGRTALEIANRFVKKKLHDHQVLYSKFYDCKNEVIDHGIAIYFKAPTSFTGEDVVEFQHHGNPIISELILKVLCEYGARLATPGEFTLRAFLNNKIDLTQAEAISDLINSATEKSVKTANRSLQGEFSNQVDNTLEELVQIRINVEAHLDFPDEDIDIQQSQQIESKLANAVIKLERIQEQAKRGERLQMGATIAIAGEPNVGKSSLINKLSQSDISIVTEIPGTTRDPLSADIEIEGVPIRLIDTAGLRETDNIIEKKGIERTQAVLEQADIVLWLTDISTFEPHNKITSSHVKDNHIVVHNKIDLMVNSKPIVDDQLYISVKTGQGIEELINIIAKKLNGEELSDVPFLARNRHIVGLKKTCDHLKSAKEKMQNNVELDIVAEELRLAQQSLGEITGEFTADELLGRIFSDFCIGK